METSNNTRITTTTMPSGPRPSQNCRVTTCCGCCDLRSGCLILGIINLIGCGIGLGVTIWLSIIFSPFMLISTLFVLILTIFNCLFIHGVRHEILKYIRIWFWISVVSMVIEIIGGIQGIVTGGVEPFLSTLLYLVVNVYLIVVMHSYIQEIVEKQSRPVIIDAEAAGGFNYRTQVNDDGIDASGTVPDNKTHFVDNPPPYSNVVQFDQSANGQMYPNQQTPYPVTYPGQPMLQSYPGQPPIEQPQPGYPQQPQPGFAPQPQPGFAPQPQPGYPQQPQPQPGYPQQPPLNPATGYSTQEYPPMYQPSSDAPPYTKDEKKEIPK